MLVPSLTAMPPTASAVTVVSRFSPVARSVNPLRHAELSAALKTPSGMSTVVPVHISPPPGQFSSAGQVGAISQHDHAAEGGSACYLKEHLERNVAFCGAAAGARSRLHDGTE